MIYENPKLVAQAIRTALIENYRQNNLDFLDANFDKFTIDKRIVVKNQELSNLSKELTEIHHLIKDKIQQIEKILSDQEIQLESQKLNALERQQAALKDDRAALERQQVALERQQAVLEDKFHSSPMQYIQDMVKVLCKILHNKYSYKVYLLIDEYDKPVNHFFEKGLENNIGNRSEVIKLISGFMSAAGKGNEHLEKIILTGIFDTLKKEGNSGFNNVQVYGITDWKFVGSFGFSDNEVSQIIDSLNFKDDVHIRKTTREWYNGYNVPINSSATMPIYSPWAVMNYFSNCQYDEKAKPENYWAESGVANTIHHLLDDRFLSTSSQFIKKISHITVNKTESFEFHKKTSLAQVKPFDYQNNEKIITYMLVNSGYVSVKEDGNLFSFRIPNAEVNEKYAEVIKDKLKQSATNQWSELLELWYGRLTYNPKTIDVVSAIITNSIEKLDQVLSSEPNLKCNNKNLKFNFFHLAAISNNQEIFDRLMLHCKDDALLIAKDNLGIGFTPIDYARIANNTKIISILENKGYNFTEINNPSLFERVVCYEYSPLLPLISILLPAVIKSLPKISNVFSFVDQKESNGILALAGIIGTGTHVSKYILKYFDSNFCYSYNSYSSIKDNTLQGFTKYIMEHPDSYLTLEQGCSDQMEAQHITVQYLEVDNNEEITFTLCQAHIMGNTNMLFHSEA